MTDRRQTPANGRVAAAALEGKVQAERFVWGERRRICHPVVDLLEAPDGRRDRQLLLGEEVTVFEDRDGWAFVQSRRDGYVGYIAADVLADLPASTHRICVPASHLYPAPDFKTRESCAVSFGAQVRVVGGEGRFFELDTGHFVPKPHLRPLNKPFTDPVTVAQLHFGVPYLWGGNSSAGIDCSGLVQASLLACGIDCPGDSDQQHDAVGVGVLNDQSYQRGDLLFWKGHVAMVVDAQTLIHANVHHMAVAYEPIAEAIERISTQGDGPVTAHKRL